jgi:predicted nucleotidyltransferase
MSTLDQLFLSRARSEVLRLLFGLGEDELHVRAMERASGLTVGTVREELQKLAAMDLVRTRRDGNRLYYTANRDHPIFVDLRSIVLKTAGLGDVLRAALQDSRIRVAFVYGSLAREEGRARSDVDVMIVGALGLRAVSKLLSGATERIGREVNAVVMEVGEFKAKVAGGDSFLKDVLSKPKMFLVGGPDELEAVA